MNIVDERCELRKAFEEGYRPECPVLEAYRKNRNSPHWRLSKQIEILCEYILYLETKSE